MIAWLIESLIASAVLMLLVLVLRGSVRRAFGADAAYAMWLLPAGRLLLPPLPGPPLWGRLVGPAMPPPDAPGVVMGVLNPDRLPAPVVDQAIASIAVGHGAEVTRLIAVPPVPAPGGPSVALIVLAFWAAGALAFIGYHVLRHSAFCRRLVQSATTERHLASGVRMIQADAATGPLAFGIWRKYVVFPADFEARYDAQERDLALAHELTHHARGDLIANWAALVVLAAHWFNPIAWRAFRAFRADQEMACDARVLAGRDPAFRHAYGRAIVKSAHGGLLGGAVSAACHLHTINDLKGRLRMLGTFKRSRLRLAGGAVSVLAITLAGLGLTASGGQAAERLHSPAGYTIGADISSLDAGVTVAPFAPLASGTDEGQLAPPVPSSAAVPVPPSAAAPAVPPVPPHPPIYVEPPVSSAATASVPPHPVIYVEPPAAPDGSIEQRREWVDKDGKRHVIVMRHRTRSEADMPNDGVAPEALALSKHDGPPIVMKRVIIRGPDGKLKTEDMKGIDIPEISSGNCPADGNEHQTVIHGNKDGKRTMIICVDRIKRLADNAARMAANSKDIERNAYQKALEGLRHAREGADVRNNAEALKGIDEAIAELQADLARLN